MKLWSGWEKEMCENIASHSKMHKSLRDQSTRCPARKRIIRHRPYDSEELFQLKETSQKVLKECLKKFTNCSNSFRRPDSCLPHNFVTYILTKSQNYWLGSFAEKQGKNRDSVKYIDTLFFHYALC